MNEDRGMSGMVSNSRCTSTIRSSRICLRIGLLSVFITMAVTSGKTEEVGLVLRPRSGAAIHVMEDLWCRPKEASSLRITAGKGEKKPFVWLIPAGPGETVDCFRNRERTLPHIGPEPKGFYLDASKAEYQNYVLVPERGFFEVSVVSLGQAEIRLKRIEEMWPAVSGESEEVQRALMDLWTRDMLNPFLAAQFKWRARDGTELSGVKRRLGGDAIVLDAPASWEAGEVTFQIGTEGLRWRIDGLTMTKSESPGPAEPGKAMDGREWYRWSVAIIMICGIVVSLIQILFRPRWRRLLGLSRRLRRRRQELAESVPYFASGRAMNASEYLLAGRQEPWTSQRDVRQQSDLASRVLKIEEQLRYLLERVQEQTIRNQQMYERVLQEVEGLAKRNVGQGDYDSRQARSPIHDTPISSMTWEDRLGPSRSANLEKVAFELLDLIEPSGRGAPLARLPELTDWLRKNHPDIEAESIGGLNRDLWLILVLTADGKTGVVVPALDSIIGPGEALKWFEGGRYDGTQALVRDNILSLGTAVRDAETQTWRPRGKGKVDLT